MSFQDGAFLPSLASFLSAFLKHCGRGACPCLPPTTCLKTVVGGRQVHAPRKVPLLHNASFWCQSNLMEII